MSGGGGTIVLLPHRYTSTLVVGPRDTALLRIVGSAAPPCSRWCWITRNR